MDGRFVEADEGLAVPHEVVELVEGEGLFVLWEWKGGVSG